MGYLCGAEHTGYYGLLFTNATTSDLSNDCGGRIGVRVATMYCAPYGWHFLSGYADFPITG